MSPAAPTLIPLLLSLALLLPSVAASGPDHDEETAHKVEVWDTPRKLDRVLLVENDTTIIVRGTTIDLHAGFVVAPRGKLVLESAADGTPPVLRAGLAEGWVGANTGEFVVRASRERPAILDGLVGEAVLNGDTILIRGAIKNVGRMDVDGMILRNYTSGLSMNPGGYALLRNVTFDSNIGVGLVVSYGSADVEDSTFVGRGGVVWSVAEGVTRVTRSTFRDVGIAIGAHGNSTIIEDVSMTNASVCVRATKGVFTVRGLSCTGFQAAGIDLSRPLSGFSEMEATLSGIRAVSDLEARAAISINGVPGVVVRDSHIGPVHENGIHAQRVVPTLENVSFEGVGEYNVVIVDPIDTLRDADWGRGEPGGEGHLRVASRFFVRASYPDGDPAVGAIVEARTEPDGTLVTRRSIGDSGISETTLLDVTRIDVDGQRTDFSYSVIAYNRTLGVEWNRTGYVPDGAGLAFQFIEGSGPNPVIKPVQKTPGVPVGLVVAGVALLALALRRRA